MVSITILNHAPIETQTYAYLEFYDIQFRNLVLRVIVFALTNNRLINMTSLPCNV